jgi:hypothetical protein
MPKSKNSRSKKQSGGADSAWSYVLGQVGDGWTQFQNALTLQPGQNMATSGSNDIEPIGKPNFQNQQGTPTSKSLTLIQSAGKRRKRCRSGGSWGAVAKHAATPLALLAMQQTYKKRSRKSLKTKKNRKSRKSRRRR